MAAGLPCAAILKQGSTVVALAIVRQSNAPAFLATL
jgi:hypothetical protein